MNFDFITEENFNKLYEKALEGYNNAYAVYSKFHVGACIYTKNGQYFTGSNIENASYGLTNCAERTALFKAYSEGIRKDDITCILIIGNTVKPVSPCGACRQVISELMNKDSYVILGNLKKDFRVYTVSQLLPYCFSEGDLNG